MKTTRTMGRVLQLTGALLMLAAIGLGLGLGVRADAEILAPLAQVIQAIKSGAIALPKAAIYEVQRGGPLQFTVSGSLSIGRTSTTSTYGTGGFFTPTPNPSASASPGPFPFQPSTTTTGQTELGAGLTTELSRRTATTLTDIKLPIGFSGTGHSAIGIAQVLYSTPKYSMGYGPQAISALGQLQLGSTLRGLTFILPERNGQATYYEGPGLGVDSEQVRLYGVLSQQVRGSTFYEGGFVVGSGEETGVVKTLLFGAATTRGVVSVTGEGAFQDRTGGDGSPRGLAGVLRFDENGQKISCDQTLRSIPDFFVAFGSGEVHSDEYGEANCHVVKIPITVGATWERTGDSTIGVSEQRFETIGYAPTLRFGGFSFNLQHQVLSSGGVTQTSNGGTAQFQTQLFHTVALLGSQLQSINSNEGSSGTQSFMAGLSRAIGRFNLGITGQIEKQTQQGVAPSPQPSMSPMPEPSVATGLQKELTLNASRNWGKTTVQLSETITRTIDDTSDALQRTPLINLTRQISPVISITTSLGYQVLSDRLNPAANGRSRVFSMSLSAPFSYGNGVVTGRVDPRLPSTIVGRVTLAANGPAGSPAGFAGLGGTGGLGNVTVVLDDKYVQKTDLSGGFQFSFVPSGQHQLRIDASSIPRGLTSATPVQTLTLKGGQQAQVTFTVGTFGGILGHVYGLGPDGAPLPLANVQLRVDGGAYSQTDTTGAYGFGGLSPGQHEVTVIPQSIPAFANLAPADLVKKVAVSNGQYSTLDFRAQPLGSISGEILYAKEMAPEFSGGYPNAYVVAEPGEIAAIDEDDGSFVLDDLPAGDYTISVDPETIDPKLGASPDSVTVHLEPGEHYQGLLFSVGAFEKKVVFSLLSGGAPAPALPAIRLSESRLPPRGTTAVSINAPADAHGVSVTAFNKRVGLTYDKGIGKWIGEIAVPASASAGSYTVTGTSGTANVPASVTLTVDPKLPIAILQYTPRNAAVGGTVTVRARFLVDVHPGDRIEWQDGTITVLGKPVAGRVFTFTKQLTLLPLHGLLLTPQGSLPIELL